MSSGQEGEGSFEHWPWPSSSSEAAAAAAAAACQFGCAVCSEALGFHDGPASLPCGHNFCLECLHKVKESQNLPACPLCREPFSKGLKLSVNRDLQEVLRKASLAEQEVRVQSERMVRAEAEIDSLLKSRVAAFERRGGAGIGSDRQQQQGGEDASMGPWVAVARPRNSGCEQGAADRDRGGGGGRVESAVRRYDASSGSVSEASGRRAERGGAAGREKGERAAAGDTQKGGGGSHGGNGGQEGPGSLVPYSDHLGGFAGGEGEGVSSRPYYSARPGAAGGRAGGAGWCGTDHADEEIDGFNQVHGGDQYPVAYNGQPEVNLWSVVMGTLALLTGQAVPRRWSTAAAAGGAGGVGVNGAWGQGRFQDQAHSLPGALLPYGGQVAAFWREVTGGGGGDDDGGGAGSSRARQQQRVTREGVTVYTRPGQGGGGPGGPGSWLDQQQQQYQQQKLPSAPPLPSVAGSREVLGCERPVWVPDSFSSHCMQCSAPFWVLCPRHHCRLCGLLFCHACSAHVALLPYKFCQSDPHRVCDTCHDKLLPVQGLLANTVSNAAQEALHDVTDGSSRRGWLNNPLGMTLEDEIFKATNTLRKYGQVGRKGSDGAIPDAVLRGAVGVAVVTVLKAGAGVTYKLGTGLVVARRPDGVWSAPSALFTAGFGWGLQVGGELSDFVIVLRTLEAVKLFCGRGQMSFGAGLSAAIGPVGRIAEADVRLGDGGAAACFTYSLSKGAFVGVSLESNVVMTRAWTNTRFYGDAALAPADILLGSTPRPKAAGPLYKVLEELFSAVEEEGGGDGESEGEAIFSEDD